MKKDCPIVADMARIIRSPAGLKAMRAAIDRGMPPLCGVDPLLSAQLRAQYSSANGATKRAGEIVRDVMIEMDFQRPPRGERQTYPCKNCVAKTAILWRAPS